MFLKFCLAVLILNGLNLGIAGLFEFNVLAWMLGTNAMLARVIYTLAGVCAFGAVPLLFYEEEPKSKARKAREKELEQITVAVSAAVAEHKRIKEGDEQAQQVQSGEADELLTPQQTQNSGEEDEFVTPQQVQNSGEKTVHEAPQQPQNSGEKKVYEAPQQ